MAKIFTLNWTPDSNANTQTVSYRIKNTTTWTITPNITPPNPLLAVADTATIDSLDTNKVYQFEVSTNCCPGVEATSAVLEGIIFEEQEITPTVTTGVININQAPLPFVDTIEYRLYDSGPTLLQTIITPGTAPAIGFTAVGAGTYTVQWRYRTAVNMVTVNSDDAVQNNAWYVSAPIIV